jgi:DNA polymerase sigma
LGGYNLSCKLYGSFACDLTLKDSDLDISIDSSILTFFLSNSQGARDQVVKSLQFLSNIFQNTEWAD